MTDRALISMAAREAGITTFAARQRLAELRDEMASSGAIGTLEAS
jgi:hypothetical protein